MELKSDENNIYQFSFREEEIPEETEEDDVDIDEYINLIMAPNTYILFVQDYENTSMVCKSSPTANTNDFVRYFADGIKSYYDALVMKGLVREAEYFKKSIKKLFNDESYWDAESSVAPIK